MLDAIPFATLGPWGAALFTISTVTGLVMTGKLLPASWVESMRADFAKREAGYEARIVEQADFIATLKQNNDLLRVQGSATTQVVRALPNTPVAPEGSAS